MGRLAQFIGVIFLAISMAIGFAVIMVWRIKGKCHEEELKKEKEANGRELGV